MKTVFFDDSLDVLARTVVDTLGTRALNEGVVLRDGTGMLCFVSADASPSDEIRIATSELLDQRLGSYARPDRVLLFADDPGAEHLLNDPERLIMQGAGHFCKVIDRRIVGSAWLETPVAKTSKPPRLVFGSLKGGVGRSTALAVTASDLAARDRNVLVIDLDLEAPGLGELMLDDDRIPRFGVLDYLVENGIGGVPDTLLGDFVGVSSLTIGGGGRVDVVPALGTRSVELPQNVLPKLARAMLENLSDEGVVHSVGAQISGMVERLAAREAYDVILIDTRAGLAELSAPAVLGLGALVLLFGTAQRQTVVGYQSLFSAMKLLAVRAVERGEPSNWRLMFKPVYAKASLDPTVAERHASDLYDLFADNLYEPTSSDDISDTGLNFPADDPDAPHAPLIIPFDPRFVDFDPSRNRDHMARAFYEQTFRPFLNGLDRLVDDLTQEPDRSIQ